MDYDTSVELSWGAAGTGGRDGLVLADRAADLGGALPRREVRRRRPLRRHRQRRLQRQPGDAARRSRPRAAVDAAGGFDAARRWRAPASTRAASRASSPARAPPATPRKRTRSRRCARPNCPRPHRARRPTGDSFMPTSRPRLTWADAARRRARGAARRLPPRRHLRHRRHARRRAARGPTTAPPSAPRCAARWCPPPAATRPPCRRARRRWTTASSCASSGTARRSSQLSDAIPTLAEAEFAWTPQQAPLPSVGGSDVELSREVLTVFVNWTHDPRTGYTKAALGIRSEGDPDGLISTTTKPLVTALAFGPALLSGVDADTDLIGSGARIAALLGAVAFSEVDLGGGPAGRRRFQGRDHLGRLRDRDALDRRPRRGDAGARGDGLRLHAAHQRRRARHQDRARQADEDPLQARRPASTTPPRTAGSASAWSTTPPRWRSRTRAAGRSRACWAACCASSRWRWAAARCGSKGASRSRCRSASSRSARRSSA